MKQPLGESINLQFHSFQLHSNQKKRKENPESRKFIRKNNIKNEIRIERKIELLLIISSENIPSKHPKKFQIFSNRKKEKFQSLFLLKLQQLSSEEESSHQTIFYFFLLMNKINNKWINIFQFNWNSLGKNISVKFNRTEIQSRLFEMAINVRWNKFITKIFKV